MEYFYANNLMRTTAIRIRDESGFGILRFPQKFFDSLGVFLGVIESKMNFGRAPKLDPLSQLVPNVTNRRKESRDGVFLLGFASYYADEYTSVLEVGRHADLGDRDKALNSRVL